MKDLGHHPNILNMVACCTKGLNMGLVMDFCAQGDLRNYLQTLREKVSSVNFIFLTLLVYFSRFFNEYIILIEC